MATRAHTPERQIEELEAQVDFRLWQADQEGRALRGEFGLERQVRAMSARYLVLKADGQHEEAQALKSHAQALIAAQHPGEGE